MAGVHRGHPRVPSLRFPCICRVLPSLGSLYSSQVSEDKVDSEPYYHFIQTLTLEIVSGAFFSLPQTSSLMHL